jgi:tungstate transport system ATP-binding protein
MSILPLHIENVSYAVNGRAFVNGLTFTLEAGARTILLGPNGAGKSLTLRLCHGLIRPTSGAVSWRGNAGGGRKRHAMVFQRPVMLRRSAAANVGFAVGLTGWDAEVRRERAREALERFGLRPLASRPARVLSGGEQQRLALARAWATRPEVLFLDEPTASLDPGAVKTIEDMITAFHAEGIKIVMSTHDLGQARRLADEVLFLHHGRLAERAPAHEFFNAPQTDAARAFLKGELLW